MRIVICILLYLLIGAIISVVAATIVGSSNDYYFAFFDKHKMIVTFIIFWPIVLIYILLYIIAFAIGKISDYIVTKIERKNK